MVNFHTQAKITAQLTGLLKTYSFLRFTILTGTIKILQEILFFSFEICKTLKSLLTKSNKPFEKKSKNFQQIIIATFLKNEWQTSDSFDSFFSPNAKSLKYVSSCHKTTNISHNTLVSIFHRITFSSYFTHISEFISMELKQPNPEITCLKPKRPSTVTEDAFPDWWLAFTISNCLGHNRSEQTAGFEDT